jgi:glycosyltransferase involved in cell wall biosynthesis
MTGAGLAPPVFSVVMATYGRGRHILPSVLSILRQDMPDFELLVVGDACTDETGAVVQGLGDPRVRWINLDQRCASQSGPNNAGIAAATADLVAYLGHDDIWEPDHLSRLLGLYRSENPPDFAVSGGIFHLPNGIPGSSVTGIFPDGADVRRHFFPPSSFAHSVAALRKTGPWRMPMEIRAPVDEDLLLRALAAGLRFRSTGAVTLHKFAAGQRYLSYVRQESEEQALMLAELGTPTHRARVAQIIDDAKRLGTYMVGADRDFDRFAPGELAQRNATRKGLRPGAARPLENGATLRHPREESALDWHRVPVLGFRRSKRNPRPKLLLPVTGGRAELRFVMACRRRTGLGPLPLRVNGVPALARPGRRWFGIVGWVATYRAEIDLSAQDLTVIEFQFDGPSHPAERGPGIAIGPLRVLPVG